MSHRSQDRSKRQAQITHREIFEQFGSGKSAYLFSCHRTASDAKYWTIRPLFIAMTISWLEKLTPLSIVPVDFFEFLSTEFVACSKPP